MKPLRVHDPPVIPLDDLDSFMEDVFHNILDVRDVNRRLLEVMEVRQREQHPIIQRIGDVFLTAATDFRVVYADYVGNLPVAEKRLKDEMDRNAELRRFLEVRQLQPRGAWIEPNTFLALFEIAGITSFRPEALPPAATRAAAEIPRCPRGYL